MDLKQLLDAHPEIASQIDGDPELKTKADVVIRNGANYLIVKQTSDFEGGTSVFELKNSIYKRVYSDNVFYFDLLNHNFSMSRLAASGSCSASSAADHAAVFETAKAQVDKFSSVNGPDHGNLACVWAVRHIVQMALNRWITQTDGTAVFAPQLQQCFGASGDESHTPAGGIIISPTQNGVVGHVGLLGDPTGDDSRLIYSNSSAAALWKQNFTVKKWRDRYGVTKGLPVLFFQLPHRTGQAPIS